MLLAVFLIGLISARSTTARYTDKVPAKPDVVENPHSAKLKVDPNDVPAGTDRVHIEAKQINDLTGDRFEAGYDFGYSPAVPYFFYPDLNDGKYHVFKVKYGKQKGKEVEWTKFSEETRFLHAEPNRYSLDLLRRNWAMAKEQCISEGKRLAVINGEKANNVVMQLLRANQNMLDEGRAWIGLFDAHYGDEDPTTTWTWVDNSPFKFAKFEYGAKVYESELNSAVVAINVEGEWETVSPDTKLPFLCEKGVTEKPQETEARVGLRETDVIM